MSEREIKAGDFKARCLQIMDEVAATGEAVVVTKRGKRVAKLVPAGAKPATGPVFGFLKHLAAGGRSLDAEETVWDGETRSGFEDGLARTAALIEGAKRPSPGSRRTQKSRRPR